MRAVVFGVHGFAGSAIAAELLDRGHDVVGVTRRESDRISPVAQVIVGSIFDPGTVERATAGADWIVIAVDSVAADGAELADAVPVLIEAARRGGARLGFVGGTGGLLTGSGDSLVMDEPWFPPAIRPTSVAHLDVFDALRGTDGVEWFQICPSGKFGAQFPGERTGAFRVGEERILVPSDGEAAISGADFAIAVADELEHPSHHNQRLTVGY
jgi:putative NADH-flavin reductase